MTDADIIANTLDGLRNTNDTLRASLHDLEKRNAEAKAALEVARRERYEARARSDFFEKEAMDWGHQNATLVVQRDTALAQAAGFRDAVAEFANSCEFWAGAVKDPLLAATIHGELAKLAEASWHTPGPTIGELQAEGIEAERRRNTDVIQALGPEFCDFFSEGPGEAEYLKHVERVQAEALEDPVEKCRVVGYDLPYVTKNDLLEAAARLRGGGE